jgi:hypothetical protein
LFFDLLFDEINFRFSCHIYSHFSLYDPAS